jgi:hypothetical protein
VGGWVRFRSVQTPGERVYFRHPADWGGNVSGAAEAKAAVTAARSLGTVVVPVRFGDQVITSLLFNHDANPVHHKPDHAVQWMLGLLAGAAGAGASEALAAATPEERTYTLGVELLQRQDVVVMPGAILAAMGYERFIAPEELTVALTTTFTYPLLVPTKGEVTVEVAGTEQRQALPEHPALGPARRVTLEAHGPGLLGARVRLMTLVALVFPPQASAQDVYTQIAEPEFARLRKLGEQKPDLPAHSHPAVISTEDARRYARIVGVERSVSPAAWQAKIPRVLTEVIDHIRNHAAYQAEAKAYQAGRADEAERRAAIARYVEQECKYRHLRQEDAPARLEELAALTQLLYARQYTVFDPRLFLPRASAAVPGAPMRLDLVLYEARLRRGIHRFLTAARLLDDRQVFMGEATVTGQPLVTRGLANFLCEINHSFNTLRVFEYRARA